jgi:hypothetical protein
LANAGQSAHTCTREPNVQVPKRGDDPAADTREKQLRKLATRGVVLFNAVAKTQKDSSGKGTATGKSGKLSKAAFLSAQGLVNRTHVVCRRVYSRRVFRWGTHTHTHTHTRTHTHAHAHTHARPQVACWAWAWPCLRPRAARPRGACCWLAVKCSNVHVHNARTHTHTHTHTSTHTHRWRAGPGHGRPCARGRRARVARARRRLLRAAGNVQDEGLGQGGFRLLSVTFGFRVVLRPPARVRAG